MNVLPALPDLTHLRKQAKALLRAARAGEPAALKRFVESLPAARGADPASLAQRELKLHDAHSVIAREYGFKSWLELCHQVEWMRASKADRLKAWLKNVYEGSVRERRMAIRVLAEDPDFVRGDAWLACAIGQIDAIRFAIAADAGWVNRVGGPMGMPPLVAVTHSKLIADEPFAASLLESAQLLLDSGADVDSVWTNPKWPDARQTAIYGAAGRTHSVAMTELLLVAGAKTDDNESLYHSVESADSTCTRLLLNAGARVTGTNALGRVLDYDKLDDLRLMLQHGGDANERPWIHHAIVRGRSIEHVRALVDAGADLRRVNHAGVSVFRYAHEHGRTDIVEILRGMGIEEPLSDAEAFIAACSRGDRQAARAILGRTPEMLMRLSARQLQTMPELAATGNLVAVRTMLELGWPREVKTAWDATALNLAANCGDAEMVELLLSHGADWRARHRFGDNVMGTLSHASLDDAIDAPASRDYVGCARALLGHGMPLPDEERYTFSPELAALFDERRTATR
jgi:ankyrin repeat protein